MIDTVDIMNKFNKNYPVLEKNVKYLLNKNHTLKLYIYILIFIITILVVILIKFLIKNP